MQLDCGTFSSGYLTYLVLTNINHMLNHRRPSSTVNELLDYYSQLQLVDRALWLNPPPCRLEIPF